MSYSTHFFVSSINSVRGKKSVIVIGEAHERSVISTQEYYCRHCLPASRQFGQNISKGTVTKIYQTKKINGNMSH